jgi:hypothetical protein
MQAFAGICTLAFCQLGCVTVLGAVMITTTNGRFEDRMIIASADRTDSLATAVEQYKSDEDTKTEPHARYAFPADRRRLGVAEPC